MASRVLLVGASLLLSCQKEQLPALALQVGPQNLLPFTPKAALVRYVEHASAPDELRLLLSSTEIGCQQFVNPGPGEVLVSVTVRVPAGESIEPGTYPWTGNLQTFAKAESAAALPFVRLAQEGRPLPAGGALRLDGVDKRLHGEVSGELLFQDGGEGETRTSGLLGAFRARICMLSLDESRRKKEE